MRGAASKGLTLIELMVVISIMAVVLGMSTAFLSKLNRGYRFTAAANQAATVVRAARNFALSSQSTAAVIVDEVPGDAGPRLRIAGAGQQVIAVWSLETGKPDSSGGFTLSPGLELARGKVGNCARVAEGTALDAGPTAKFPAGVGVGLAGWFYSEGGGPPQQVLFDFGGALTVLWESDGSVNASGGGKTVSTPPGVMIPHRWTHVEVVYDRSTLALAIDGVFLGEVDASEELARSSKPLTAGGKQRSFVGLIDEVRLTTVVRPEEIQLPEGVVWAGGVEQIRFDRQGCLDPLHHPEPAVIWLYSQKDKEWRKLVVSRMGRVRLTTETEGPQPKPRPKKKQAEKKSNSTGKK